MSLTTIVGKAAAQNDTALGKLVTGPLYPPPTYTKPEGDMVARLREAAAAGQFWTGRATTRERGALTETVARYLTEQARQSAAAGGDRIPFWTHLNATPTEVARVFVDMVISNRQGVLSNLPRINGQPGVGREGLFNGWLFQRYALNHVVLHRDMREISARHVAEVNRALARSPATVVDAQSTPLDLRGSFGAPRRATDFWLTRPRDGEAPTLGDVDPRATYDWDEWIDCGYVAPLVGPRGGWTGYWTMAIGLELKRSGAARDFSRQIGGMLARMQGSDVIRMTLDGTPTPLLVPTRAFVFLPDSRWLAGATSSLTHQSEYDFVGTRRGGGYPETYLRMRIRFDTTPIDRLSGLLFRAVL